MEHPEAPYGVCKLQAVSFRDPKKMEEVIAFIEKYDPSDIDVVWREVPPDDNPNKRLIDGIFAKQFEKKRSAAEEKARIDDEKKRIDGEKKARIEEEKKARIEEEKKADSAPPKVFSLHSSLSDRHRSIHVKPKLHDGPNSGYRLQLVKSVPTYEDVPDILYVYFDPRFEKLMYAITQPGTESIMMASLESSKKIRVDGSGEDEFEVDGSSEDESEDDAPRYLSDENVEKIKEALKRGDTELENALKDEIFNITKKLDIIKQIEKSKDHARRPGLHKFGTSGSVGTFTSSRTAETRTPPPPPAVCLKWLDQKKEIHNISVECLTEAIRGLVRDGVKTGEMKLSGGNQAKTNFAEALKAAIMPSPPPIRLLWRNQSRIISDRSEASFTKVIHELNSSGIKTSEMTVSGSALAKDNFAKAKEAFNSPVTKKPQEPSYSMLLAFMTAKPEIAAISAVLIIAGIMTALIVFGAVSGGAGYGALMQLAANFFHTSASIVSPTLGAVGLSVSVITSGATSYGVFSMKHDVDKTAESCAENKDKSPKAVT